MWGRARTAPLFFVTRFLVHTVLVAGFSLAVTTASAVQLNTTAPDFSLKDLTGKAVYLKNYRGKALILNFWSTTCPPCVSEMPALNKLYRDLAGEGLLVLGISLDPGEKPVRDLLSRLHIEYPVLLDPAQEVYFDTYALFGQPVSIFIDRSGVVREKIVGPIDWDSQQMRAKVRNLLRGK